jgi:hypothetical protein
VRLDFERALGLAALAHAVAMALLCVARLAPVQAAHTRPPGPSESEIDVELDRPRAHEPPSLPAPEEPTSRDPVAAAAARSAWTPRESPTPAAPFEGAPADDSAASPSAGAWSLSPFRAAAAGAPSPELGLGKKNAMGQAALHAAFTEASRAERDEGDEGAGASSVASALDARDHEAGLGPGGPLVKLAREAVRDSLAPNVGHALFELRTDGAGIVLSVRVLDATSDRRSWEDVAAKLADSARAHPLKVPPGARGVAVTLRVDSAVRTKSGHDAGETRVTLMGIPLKKSRAPHPVDVNIALPMASVDLDPTDLLLDATTKPERVVNAWIVAEQRL